MWSEKHVENVVKRRDSPARRGISLVCMAQRQRTHRHAERQITRDPGIDNDKGVDKVSRHANRDRGACNKDKRTPRKPAVFV